MKVSQLISVLQEMNPELEVTMETLMDHKDGAVIFETPRRVHGVGSFISGHDNKCYAIIRHGNRISRRKQDNKE